MPSPFNWKKSPHENHNLGAFIRGGQKSLGLKSDLFLFQCVLIGRYGQISLGAQCSYSYTWMFACQPNDDMQSPCIVVVLRADQLMPCIVVVLRADQLIDPMAKVNWHLFAYMETSST